MSKERDISTEIIRYLDGDMSDNERSQFESRLMDDEGLRKELDEVSSLKLMMGELGEEESLRDRMNDLHSKVETQGPGKAKWKLALAATVLLIVGVGMIYQWIEGENDSTESIAEVQGEEEEGAKEEAADAVREVVPLLSYKDNVTYGVMIGDQGIVLTPSTETRYSKVMITEGDTAKINYSMRIGAFDLYDSDMSVGGSIGKVLGDSLYIIDLELGEKVYMKIIDHGDLLELTHTDDVVLARGLPLYNNSDEVVALVEGAEGRHVYANQIFSLSEELISLKRNIPSGRSVTCKMIK